MDEKRWSGLRLDPVRRWGVAFGLALASGVTVTVATGLSLGWRPLLMAGTAAVYAGVTGLIFSFVSPVRQHGAAKSTQLTQSAAGICYGIWAQLSVLSRTHQGTRRLFLAAGVILQLIVPICIIRRHKRTAERGTRPEGPGQNAP